MEPLDSDARLVGDDAIREVWRRIDTVIAANRGLAHRLGTDRPTHDDAWPDALVRYGPGEMFELWLIWWSIEHLREAAEIWRRFSMLSPIASSDPVRRRL